MAQNIKNAINDLLTGKIGMFTLEWEKIIYDMPKRLKCETRLCDGNIMITQYETDLATKEYREVLLPLPIRMAMRYLCQITNNHKVSFEYN